MEQLCDKTWEELGDDAELIGSVRDVISEEFARRGIMTEMDFYPYLDEEVSP